MTTNGIWQVVFYLGTLLACAPLLGHYMATVYRGSWDRRIPLLGSLESVTYRLCRIDPNQPMDWRGYSRSVIALSFVSFVIVYTLQRLQANLPFNPMGLPSVSPDSAFNTAVSFVTNTNWQGYSGESTLSYGTQMLGLTVQNFISAAVGMAVLVAFCRGFARQRCEDLGNFWVDLIRGIFYILAPLSILLALVLVSQGVVQTFQPSAVARLLEPTTDATGKTIAKQHIAVGPAASQIAIKQLGTNGGGFFNANSAHPFENPTPLSNFLEMLAILLIPAALCFTFGELIGDRRQGWSILVSMLLILIPLLFGAVYCEQRAHAAITAPGVDQVPSETHSGGNMEGKEVRFGIVGSATWGVLTTAASNGSVNAMHDSFNPLAGLIAIWLIQLGEVVFGGVGSGLYGMLVFVIVAVFIAGLMVGRTPEYLGKKIGAWEMKMAALAILLPCVTVLVGTAVAVTIKAGTSQVANGGPHGFTEILYAFSSAANNNGSAFAGLSANTPFYNGLLGIAMLVGRFGVMIPVLAMAGSLALKPTIPTTSGTLPTHTPLFIGLLVAVVLLVGALSFFPALALGPIVEQLQLLSQE